MTRRRAPGAVPAGVVLALALLAACVRPPEAPPRIIDRGDPAAGAAAIERHACGACHIIPGIRGARSPVGPPLEAYSRRAFVAGTLPNNQDNLVRFLLDPDRVRPGTAMPDLGLTEREAEDIAAYLLGLG